MRSLPCFILFPALLLAASVAKADNSLAADRPGFSTATTTVAPGRYNIEGGIQWTDGDNADSYTAPLLNVRIGLTPQTELNVLWDGWTKTDGTNTNHADLGLGAKHKLIVTDSYNISVLGFLFLPTGSDSDSEDINPFLGLLWDRSLSDSIDAFGTLQVVTDREDSKRHYLFQPAVGLAFSHTDKFGSFIEYYRDISLNSNRPDTGVFDAGITYLLNNDVQLDLNGGISLDKHSDDFVGLGVAMRF